MQQHGHEYLQIHSSVVVLHRPPQCASKQFLPLSHPSAAFQPPSLCGQGPPWMTLEPPLFHAIALWSHSRLSMHYVVLSQPFSAHKGATIIVLRCCATTMHAYNLDHDCSPLCCTTARTTSLRCPLPELPQPQKSRTNIFHPQYIADIAFSERTSGEHARSTCSLVAVAHSIPATGIAASRSNWGQSFVHPLPICCLMPFVAMPV